MSNKEINLILLEAELAPEDYSFDSEPEVIIANDSKTYSFFFFFYETNSIETISISNRIPINTR